MGRGYAGRRALGAARRRAGAEVAGDLESLRTFLIVYQDEARVEVWTRVDGWSMRGLGIDDVLDLPELGGTPGVSDLYDRVTF